MPRRDRRTTTAALAILALGITAGFGSGHDCLGQSPPPASDLRAESVPEGQQQGERDVVCVACVLQAQFGSLRLSVIPEVLPPPSITAGVNQRDLTPTSRPRLHSDARGPPQAPPDSRTV